MTVNNGTMRDKPDHRRGPAVEDISKPIDRSQRLMLDKGPDMLAGVSKNLQARLKELIANVAIGRPESASETAH